MGSQANGQSEGELKSGGGGIRQMGPRPAVCTGEPRLAAGSPRWSHIFIQGQSWSVPNQYARLPVIDLFACQRDENLLECKETEGLRDTNRLLPQKEL